MDPVVPEETPEETLELTKEETALAVRTEEDVLSTVNPKLAECESHGDLFFIFSKTDEFRKKILTTFRISTLVVTLRRPKLLDGELMRARRNSRLRFSPKVTPRKSKPLPELLLLSVKLPSRRRTTLKPTSNTSPLKPRRSSTSLPSPRLARPTKV